MIRAAYKRSYAPDGREHLAIGNRGENKDKHVGRPSTWRPWTDEEWTAWIHSEGHGAEEGKGWRQSQNSGTPASDTPADDDRPLNEKLDEAGFPKHKKADIIGETRKKRGVEDDKPNTIHIFSV